LRGIGLLLFSSCCHYFVIMEHESNSDSSGEMEDISVDESSSDTSASEIEITVSDSDSFVDMQQAQQ
jgi:hypothetical protein